MVGVLRYHDRLFCHGKICVKNVFKLIPVKRLHTERSRRFEDEFGQENNYSNFLRIKTKLKLH